MLTRNLFRRPRIKLEDTGDTQAQRPEIPEELYEAVVEIYLYFLNFDPADPEKYQRERKARQQEGESHGV